MTTTNDVLVTTGNEALQSALTFILQRSITAVDAGVAFLSAEIPDVIQQLLMWHAVSSFIVFFLSLLVWLVSMRMFWPNIKCGKKLNDYDEGRYKETWTHNKYGELENPLPYLLPIFVSLVCFAITSSNMAWLQIWIAPKIFLIEYAASLVK